MKYIKTAIFLLLMTCLIIACPKAASAKVHKVRSASDWKKIGTYKGGKFKLTKNINLSTKQYLTITKKKKYTIDFNGYKVTDNGTGSTNCPLEIKKGTVTLKSSRPKKGGVLYSKEWVSVAVSGKAKLFLKSGAVVNDTVEFRTGLASAIYLMDSAKCYIQGKSIVQSINNGISMMGKSKLFLKGTPRIRAGYQKTDIMFTHYGSGIAIAESGCSVSLKGGSVGTMATPDTTYGGITYTGSGSYPILDREGQSLKLAPGYHYLDYSGAEIGIDGSNVDKLFQRITGSTGSSGLPGETKLTTQVADPEGFYTIFIMK